MAYNQLDFRLDRVNSSKIVEFQNPATGAFVDGSLVSGTSNTFAVSMTGIPAGSYSNLVGRLKGTSITAVYPGPVTVANPPGGSTQLSTPTGLATTATSSSTIGVSWNGVQYASSYQVQRAADSAFTVNVTIVYAGTGLSVVDGNLSASTPYYYRVLAVGTGSYTNSAYSAGMAATTPAAGVNPPTLGAPSPTTGPAASQVTLSGTNLSNATGYAFNGVAGSASSISNNTATSITLVVPAGATSGYITVTTPSGTATSSSPFTVGAASGTPTITAVNPASGPVGSQVTISGTNLDGASQVKLHGTAATVVSNTATSLVFQVPSGATSGTISFVRGGVTVTSSTAFQVTVSTGVPPDRVRKLALSDASYAKALAGANRVLTASTITFNGGTTGISPGTGTQYYTTREWRRDRTMADIGHPNFTTAQSKADSYQRFLDLATPQFWIPDRIQTSGVQEDTPFAGMVRSPLDNNCFEVEQCYLHFKQTGSASLYASTKTKLDAVALATEKTQSGATSELPLIEDQAVDAVVYTQEFGFFDSEYTSGYGLYIAALYYRACRRLAEMNYSLGNTADGDSWVAKAGRLKAKINDTATGLWDDSYGMFRSATAKGREVHDLPSNTIAVITGLADDAKAIAISQKINSQIADGTFRGALRMTNLDDDVQPGYSAWRYFVRKDQAGTANETPRIFQVVDDSGNQVAKPGGGFYSGADAATPSPYGEYQNGGYWYTFIAEILATLALTNETAAIQFLYDAIYWGNLDLARDNVECLSVNGRFRCSQYSASAAGILGAVTGGGADPSGVTPDPTTGITGEWQHFSKNANGNIFTDTAGQWELLDNNALSYGDSAIILSGGRNSILKSQPLDFTNEYPHLAMPSTPTLGPGRVRMTQVVNGTPQTPGDWLSFTCYSADERFSNVRWVSDNPLTGSYIFEIDGPPNNANYVTFDRLFKAVIRTAPVA